MSIHARLGGAGGYVKCYLTVTPGESLSVLVGQGGYSSPNNYLTTPYGGGGRFQATR